MDPDRSALALPPQRKHDPELDRRLEALEPHLKQRLCATLPVSKQSRYVIYGIAWLELPYHRALATEWAVRVATGKGRTRTMGTMERNARVNRTWLKAVKPVEAERLNIAVNKLTSYLLFLGRTPIHSQDVEEWTASTAPPRAGPSSTADDLREYLNIRMQLPSSDARAAHIQGLRSIDERTANEIRKTVHNALRDLFGETVAHQKAPQEFLAVRTNRGSQRWPPRGRVARLIEQAGITPVRGNGQSYRGLRWQCLLVLVAAGLPASIAAGLRRDDVAFSHDGWAVIQTPTGWLGLLCDSRPLSELKLYLLATGDEGYLNPSPSNPAQPISSLLICNRITRDCDSLGVPHTPARQLNLYGGAEMLVHQVPELYVQRVLDRAETLDILQLKDDAELAHADDPHAFRSRHEILNDLVVRHRICRRCATPAPPHQPKCARCHAKISTPTPDAAEDLHARMLRMHELYLAASGDSRSGAARRALGGAL